MFTWFFYCSAGFLASWVILEISLFFSYQLALILLRLSVSIGLLGLTWTPINLVLLLIFFLGCLVWGCLLLTIFLVCGTPPIMLILPSKLLLGLNFLVGMLFYLQRFYYIAWKDYLKLKYTPHLIAHIFVFTSLNYMRFVVYKINTFYIGIILVCGFVVRCFYLIEPLVGLFEYLTSSGP